MTEDKMLDLQRAIWTLGDYGAIAERLRPISVDLLDTVGVAVGDRVLDVGMGDGNTAIEAARRGGEVTGIDLTPAQVDKARARMAAEGVDVTLAVGNAEHLEVTDAAFDTVVSVMGVIFVPDHEAAAGELARVCRPGGVVALTSWANEGWHRAWRDNAAGILSEVPSGTPDPDAWSDPDELARRLAAAGLDAEVLRREFRWTFPTPADGADFLRRNAGPFIALEAAATAAGNGGRVREALVDALARTSIASDPCVVPSPYLLAVARR
jgi:2-polyprenyl-3-methyl-5-hydroxy-6-metoxy-1,4-benzoquinol methylase